MSFDAVKNEAWEKAVFDAIDGGAKWKHAKTDPQVLKAFHACHPREVWPTPSDAMLRAAYARHCDRAGIQSKAKVRQNKEIMWVAVDALKEAGWADYQIAQAFGLHIKAVHRGGPLTY